MDGVDAALKAAGTPFSTRTVREALKKLRDQDLATTVGGRHAATDAARAGRVDEELAALRAEEDRA
jgi:hypothetical protein